MKLTLWSQKLTSWNAVRCRKCQKFAEVDTANVPTLGHSCTAPWDIQTTRASLHNPLLLYKFVANRLNNACKNHVTIKKIVQSHKCWMTSFVWNAKHIGVQASQHSQSIQHGIYPTYTIFTGSKSSSSYILSFHRITVLANIYICVKKYPKLYFMNTNRYSINFCKKQF